MSTQWTGEPHLCVKTRASVQHGFTSAAGLIREIPCWMLTALTGLVAVLGGGGTLRAQGIPADSAAEAARELANQVNNPAAPVTLLQVRNILLPNVAGTDGATNTLELQPVLPVGRHKALPFVAPFVQLLKVTLPIPFLPSPVNEAGLGDLQAFDLVSIKQSWGRWGFGLSLVFPTATSTALGQGKWQAGPAAALIYTGIRNLAAGAVLQNPISYAGPSSRPSVNNLIVSPTLTYSMHHGWFAGLSDFNWTFDWEQGGAATIPLGLQVGKILAIGKLPVSFSVEAGGAVAKPASTPDPGWIIGIEVTPILRSREHR